MENNKNLEQLVKSFVWMAQAKKAILSFYEKKGNNDTCLILPTGMGKSIVALAVIKDLFKKGEIKKVLYLAPNDYIISQTKENWDKEGHDIDYMTYPQLLALINKDQILRFAEYDFIVADEFHRLGAPEWGRAFDAIRMFPNKILGLTATETRYLDNGRDMAKELFDDNIAYKMTNRDAWKRGYQIPPIYVISYQDEEKEFEGLEKKLTKISNPVEYRRLKNEIEELKANWKNTLGISGILKKYLIDNRINNNQDPLEKLLVFHTTVEETEGIKDLMTKYLYEAGFKKFKFYYCNVGVNKGDCSIIQDTTSLKQLELFNNEEYDGLKVMLSISMLGEGLHVEGAHAEIMFRSTMSKNLFLQIIGRVLSFKNEEPSVIIDLVQNVVLSSEYSSDYVVKNPSAKKTSKEKSDEEDEVVEEELTGRMMVVHDYRLPTVNLSNYIDSYNEEFISWLDMAERGDFSWMELEQ